tara:strand:- start:937 stop:1311 length:375 start_codon:yes stop_codon:yes gene_type:complete
MDIDFFKSINDTYGHPGGDEVLKSFANKLETSCKPNLVGRVGGEEFIAVIDKIKDESIEEYCENLRKEIVDLSIKFQDHNIKVTMSGGVASSDEIDNLEDLINLADERLYEAKEGGRNQIIFRK